MKTEELTGAALDWAVKKAIKKDGGYFLPSKDYKNISHSTDWSQGGPIIERELIAVRFICEGRWESWWSGWPKSFQVVYGETPLVAAMRCYVASKLGEEVEIPKGMCDENL